MTLLCPPDESEFLERGFDLSSTHNPDEGVTSFVRCYSDGTELVVTFQIGSISSIYVSVARQAQVLSEITIECIENISFQSWHGERTIRGSFSLQAKSTDLRVHYDPVASVHFAVLSQNG